MPQKIYARQVPPEQQDSSICLNGLIEDGVIIYGNDRLRDFNGEIVDEARETIDVNDEGELTAYLSEKYGCEYESHEIRGCVQREWNTMYAPKKYCTKEYINLVESLYFNTGMEIESCLSYDEINSPDDIDSGEYGYFNEYDEEGLKKRLKERYGVNCEVVLWMFDGWKRTPKYKRV